MMDARIFLQGIEHTIGEIHSIDELEEVQQDEERAAKLHEQGMDVYALATEPAAAMFERAARRTLERTGTDPGDVSFLVYCTQHRSATGASRHDVHQALDRLGLTRAYPIGVCLSACANMYAGLRVATALVREHPGTRVLLASADRLVGDQIGYSRFLPNDVAVISDGAATCMVGDAGGDFELLGSHQHIDPSMSRLALDGDFDELMPKYVNGTRDTIHGLLSRLEVKTGDLAAMVPQSINLTMIRLAAALARVPMERVFVENCRRYGHVQASDTLVNLRDWTDASQPEAGSRALLFGLADHVWGSAVVRRC